MTQISYLDKKPQKWKHNIITPRNKLSILFNKKVEKQETELQLTKLSGKLANIDKKNQTNSSILCAKKEKRIGRKRMKSKEIVDIVFIKGLHNFDDYETLNPMEIRLE